MITTIVILVSQDPVGVVGGNRPVVISLAMGTLLTKRRAVDLCRVAACLCPRVP